MIKPVKDVDRFVSGAHGCPKCGQTMQYAGCEPFYGPPNHPVIRCPGCECTYHVMTVRDAQSYGMAAEQIAERMG